MGSLNPSLLSLWHYIGTFSIWRGQGGQGGKGSMRIQRALNQNLRNCHESETSPPPPRRLGAEIAHLGILTLLYSISSWNRDIFSFQLILTVFGAGYPGVVLCALTLVNERNLVISDVSCHASHPLSEGCQGVAQAEIILSLNLVGGMFWFKRITDLTGLFTNRLRLTISKCDTCPWPACFMAHFGFFIWLSCGGFQQITILVLVTISNGVHI